MEFRIRNGGKLYSSKGRVVFVATEKESCPRINLTNSSKTAKFRDDFSKGLKTSKSFAKIIFK